MNKTVKILAILLVVTLIASISSFTFATELDPGTMQPTAVNNEKISSLGSKILGYVRNIAAVLSVVLLAILGVKFMIGSTEERAEYKKSFLPLIIGLFVVLSASTLAGWIWSAFK